MKKKSFEYIDLFKFIFSICIVALHTLLLSDFNDHFNWYITHGIFRLAVPFFFMTSGFFYGRKILIKNKEIKEITKKYITKLFYPFIFWLFISLPIEFINTYEGNILTTVLIIIKKIFFYPWGALWYILALIVSIYILSKFYNKGKFLSPILIGFILYIFALLSNSYYFIIDNFPITKKIVDSYIQIFISSRNGIFVGLLFVSIGVFIAKLYQEKKLLNIKQNLIGFTVGYCFLLFEIYFIRKRAYIDDSSLFIVMPLVIFFLISILIKISNNQEYKILRNYSIGLYLIHRPVLGYLKLFFEIDYGINLFIATLSITFLIYYLLQKWDNKFIRLITMQN